MYMYNIHIYTYMYMHTCTLYSICNNNRNDRYHSLSLSPSLPLSLSPPLATTAHSFWSTRVESLVLAPEDCHMTTHDCHMTTHDCHMTTHDCHMTLSTHSGQREWNLSSWPQRTVPAGGKHDRLSEGTPHSDSWSPPGYGRMFVQEGNTQLTECWFIKFTT